MPRPMVDWIFVLGFGTFSVLVHAAVWAIATMGAGSRPRRDKLSGELILEYGSGARIIAVALGMFPVPILLGATRLFTDVRPLETEGRAWLVILAFFFLFSLPFSIEFFGVSHRLTRDGIHKGSPWSRKFFANWDSILLVRYSVSFEGYIMKTMKGTIRLSRYLRGIGEFLEALAQHVPQERLSPEMARVLREISEQLQGSPESGQLGRSE